MQLTNRFKVLFIIFIVLGVYYPSIFAGVNSVDDYKMISVLEDAPAVDFKALFLPGSGYYYRPLLMLTFFADKYLWGFDESFMHLENILIHALNAVLVFWIASRLFKQAAQNLELPLLSALLFALHPINTEAVAWISGRTDPLATIFVLSSLLLLIKGLETNRPFFLLSSTILLIIGGMCKEVAVFFFPVACMIAYFWENESETTLSERSRGIRLVTVALPFIIGGAGYLLLRFMAYGTKDTGIARIFTGHGYDLFNTVRVIFKVFGFYVKKLFMPLPLNFAIMKLDNNYVWFGIAVAFIMIILLVRRRQNMSVILLCSAFFLIAPAILVALASIAWTPVAERYLYLPSAIFSIGFVGSIYCLLNSRKFTASVVPCFVIILFPAGWATVQRTITWQNNISLYQDTLNKSPDHSFIKNELAIAMIAKGRDADAERQIEEAKLLDPTKKNVLVYVNQAKLRYTQGKLDDARDLLLQTFTKKSEANPEVLKMLTKIDEQRLFHSKSYAASVLIYKELLDTHENLYPKTGDPISLYRGGQMSLQLGDKQKARELFHKAYQAAPDDAHYKQAAFKLAEKLSR